MRSSIRFAVVFQLLGLSAALPRSLPLEARASDTYDYIIVGGGVTGLIVANRLTEDEKSGLRLSSLSLAGSNICCSRYRPRHRGRSRRRQSQHSVAIWRNIRFEHFTPLERLCLPA
jgi:hypothetical protein